MSRSRRLLSAASIAGVLTLAGCAQISGFFAGQAEPAAAAPVTAVDTSAPLETRRPPATAVTEEDFDTSTEAERAAAAAPPASADTSLGTVVVSLGSPVAQGFWLETPLVSAVTPGRVELAGGGASANVELRPAPAGSGSRLSLAAMRLLGVPVTDLPEVEVFRRAESG